ncbi:MAG: hypothetical protein PHP50_13915 [Lachnospiraceae bacterium]|nr:hypothetical protein [Lachnospiraceae bacterium]
MKGKLGKPQYSYDDKVDFTFDFQNQTLSLTGVIRVVDPNGTIEQSEEPSYDIEAFHKGEICLFKHVRESSVFGLEEL